MRAPPRWLWILSVIFCACLLWLRNSDAFGDQGLRNVASFFSVLIPTLILWLWLLRGANLPRILKRWLFLCPCIGLLTAAALLEFHGFTGFMIPRLSWRFASTDSDEGPSSSQVQVPQALDIKPRETDYPGFLGSERDGRSDALPLAASWEHQAPTLLWRQPVGLGWSGFAIQGEVAVTMEERGSQTGLYAYHLLTGKPLWSHEWPATFQQVLAGPGPRCTPTLQDGRVFGQDAHGRIECVSLTDGQPLWSRNLLEEHGVTLARESELVLYGRSASPLGMGNLLVVPSGGDPETKLVGITAFDTHTGATVWESPPRQQSYASPAFAHLAGRDQVLVVNEGSVTGHDPTNGELLWEYPWPSHSSEAAAASQPVPLPPDSVLCSKGYGMGCLRIRLVPDGESGFQVEPQWHERRVLRTKLTNMVLHEGHAYGLSDGILECVNLESGRRVWKGGRYGHGQVLLARDLLLVQTEDGQIILRRASPLATPDSPEGELGRIDALTGKAWNHMALAGDVLLVRSDLEASAWRLPLQGQ